MWAFGSMWSPGLPGFSQGRPTGTGHPQERERAQLGLGRRESVGPSYQPGLISSLYKKVRTRQYRVPAWYKVRANGLQSPSDDTRQAIRRFQKDEHRNLERIYEELKAQDYEFAPARAVDIDRGPGKDPRPIVVHHVRDRIVQRSLLDVLMDVDRVRTVVDHHHSFGGLPGKGPPDAIRLACEVIDDGAAWHLRSDVKDFFSHIPRRRVLADLTSLLPDDTLNSFLDDATRVEYENEEELRRRHLLDLFPDDALGVPQGHSLSAFLGNFLLRPFDDVLNATECTCIRYLDDFLILGPDEATVWKTYKQGRALLDDLGLGAYHPKDSDKASAGSSLKAFDFLGCQISDGFVLPSSENRSRLRTRVREKLEASRRAMMGGAFSSPGNRDISLVTTLSELSRSLRAWAEQFDFCNASDVMRHLDSEIDEMLGQYIGTYDNHKSRGSEEERRRMLGVSLLQDVDADPILPLDRSVDSDLPPERDRE